MPRVYCIPGLGNDTTMYDNLIPLLDSQNIYLLDHIEPESRRESLQSYTRRLAATITNHDDYSIVIGMSLGGMIAVELSKLLPMQRVFVISSVKHHKEKPNRMNLVKTLGLYHLAQPFFMRNLAAPIGRVTRTTDRIGLQHVQKQLKACSNAHLRWGARAAVRWKTDAPPENAIHIHGTRDEFFPIRYVNPTHVIRGGSHYMLMDRAPEIANIINPEIQIIKANEGKIPLILPPFNRE